MEDFCFFSVQTCENSQDQHYTQKTCYKNTLCAYNLFMFYVNKAK